MFRKFSQDLGFILLLICQRVLTTLRHTHIRKTLRAVLTAAKPFVYTYSVPVTVAYTAPVAYSAYSAYSPVAYSAYPYTAPYSYYI
ncbi:hypothetical protein ABMA27_004428 [Loxostege sticticalis]|uniref:Uncharacterized protein n=1 Tax=Loxostege sticticalis TaxID=481309 RepID=A0ABR3HNM2_LOXSC